MRCYLASLLLCACVPVAGQETQLGSDFRREGAEFKENCTDFSKIFGCAQTLVTGKPLHLSIGSIAPGNGVAFGPAFVYEKNSGENWRLNFNADAVASTNQSWRAGLYLKAFYIPKTVIGTTTERPKPGQPAPKVEPKPAPEFNLYVQGASLNQLGFYGLGPTTSRQGLAFFGLTETIAGGNTIYPVLGHSGISLSGELNGRIFDPRGRLGQTSPSIEQLYPALPGLPVLRQLGYFQTGEGVKFNRSLAARLNFDYSLTLQQYVGGSGSKDSFQRLTIDASHEIPLYRNQTVVARSEGTGPDESPKTLEKNRYHVGNREGSVTLRAVVSESFIPTGNTVPYFLQPTLGGTDINGDKGLSSYPDYRFRAPNLMLFRASLEHSIWGPIGGILMVDYGRVALTHGDLGFDHFRHSWGVGVTVRAGGLPAVSLLFAFGGGEGTHTLANISPAFLGSSRPSFF